MVEHATENRGVHSSILCLGTLGQKFGPRCGRSTVVVRLLAKEKVVGSNPIARSEVYKVPPNLSKMDNQRDKR